MPLHTSFELNARLYPDKVALIFGNESVTYGELDHAATSMASNLVDSGVKFGDIVPILLDRTPKLVISIIALLKIGAVYNILDTKLHKKKLGSLINFLGASLLIVEDKYSSIKQSNLKTFTPTIDYSNNHIDYITSLKISNNHPACVFFTSGSTGEPKAILSSHKATLRLFNASSLLPFSDKSVVALAAALPWDAFSLELWGALVKCGTLWIINEAFLTPNLLRNGVLYYKLDTVWLTSSLFNSIVEEDIESFAGLSTVITGGERLSVNHVKKFLLHYPNIDIINGYGPVESTIFATMHKIDIKDCNNKDIPIGLPVPSTKIFILNKNGIQCQKKQIGEICVCGDGLAIEYLNNKNLTEKKFKTILFNKKKLRVYFTGDLGFVGDDGLFHYCGRKDRQVKVSGRIVDLGLLENKIDALLLDYNISSRTIAIKDKANITTKLAAFFTIRDKNISESDIKTLLIKSLDKHEYPYIIQIVNKFPLTSRGKINDTMLLEYIKNHQHTPEISQPSYTPKNNNICNVIFKIFYDITGVYLNFDTAFQKSGISSIDLGRVCMRINKEFKSQIPISILYKYPTILSLSDYLENQKEDCINSNPPHTLNHMQIVYLTKYCTSPNLPHCYCLMTWKIDGNVDIERLQNAVNYTHIRNKSLRSRYSLEPLNYKSISSSYRINPPDIINLPSVDSEKNALLSLRKVLGQGLNPIQGAIWRSSIIKLAKKEVSYFGCVVHHIAFDGYSEHLFAKDLSYGYNNKNTFKLPLSSPLVHKNIISTNSSEEIRIKEISTRLNSCDKIHWTNLQNQNKHSNSCYNISTILDASLVSKIDKIAKICCSTKFNVLFHCWTKALSLVTRNQNICVGIPVRQRDISHTNKRIGCYINMVYVSLNSKCFEDEDGFNNIVQEIQYSMKNQDISVMDTMAGIYKEGKDISVLSQVLFALQDNPPPLMHLKNLKVNFIRQSYFNLPFELHAEIWPQEDGSMELIMSYQEIIPRNLINSIARLFLEHLNSLKY
ncbi:MAG: AMP-binding protein [Rickettsiaceae bacterium]